MTISLKFDDRLVDAVIAKLEAGMPGRIQSINIEKHDGIVLSAPLAYYHGGANEVPPAPAIIVSRGEVARFEFEGTHGFIPWTQVLVTILAEDADRQALDRRLERLARAVIEAVWDGDPVEQLSTADFSAFRIVPQRMIPGPTARPQTTNVGWRSFTTVVFLTKHLEGL